MSGDKLAATERAGLILTITGDRGRQALDYALAQPLCQRIALLNYLIASKVLPGFEPRLEQSHRRIKHRYYPTLGCGEFDAAQRFCQGVDEVGNFLRPQLRMAEFVCLSERRQ